MKLNVLILLLLVGLVFSKVVPKDKKKPKDNKKEVTATPVAITLNSEDNLLESQSAAAQSILDHVKDIFESWVSIVQQIISSGNLEEGNVHKKLVLMMRLGEQDGLTVKQYEDILYYMALKDLKSGGALTSLVSEYKGKDGLIDENDLENLSLALAEQLDSSKEDIKQTFVFLNTLCKSLGALGLSNEDISESVAVLVQLQMEERTGQFQITEEDKTNILAQVIANTIMRISKQVSELKSLGFLPDELVAPRAVENQNESNLESGEATEPKKANKITQKQKLSIIGNVEDIATKTLNLIAGTVKAWLGFLTSRDLKVRSLAELKPKHESKWDIFEVSYDEDDDLSYSEAQIKRIMKEIQEEREESLRRKETTIEVLI